MKFRVGLLLPALVLLFSFQNDLMAHGGQFKPPSVGTASGTPGGSGTSGTVEKGVSFPGGGPQIPFRESRWEFWWDFHHEPLMGLRKALHSRTPSAGVIDFPFEQITVDEKRVKIVRQLVTMLKSKEQAIRTAAVISLARTRDENIIPYLEMTYTDDMSLNVRTMAVLAMGITRNPRAIGTLYSIMNDESESSEIRFFASVSLGMIGGEKVATLFGKRLGQTAFRRLDKDLRRGLAFASGLSGDPTLAPMVRSLLINQATDDDVTRSFLVLSLGRLGDRAANPILIQCLEKAHVQIRRSAAIALGAVASPSDKDVIKALGKAADTDADLMVKNFSLIALGRIGGKDAEKVLIKLFNEVAQSKLPFAAIGLGLLGNADNGALILHRFKTLKSNSGRAAMAISLGLLKYTPALGELRKAMDKERDPSFLSYCAQALGMMRDVESIERLRKACSKANDVELIRSTAIALGLIGDNLAAKVLTDMMDPKNSGVIRSTAAYSLGLIGDRKAIEHLFELATDKQIPSLVRSYAVTGLGLLSDDQPVPVISRITRNNNYTIMEGYLYELFNIN